MDCFQFNFVLIIFGLLLFITSNIVNYKKSPLILPYDSHDLAFQGSNDIIRYNFGGNDSVVWFLVLWIVYSVLFIVSYFYLLCNSFYCNKKIISKSKKQLINKFGSSNTKKMICCFGFLNCYFISHLLFSTFFVALIIATTGVYIGYEGDGSYTTTTPTNTIFSTYFYTFEVVFFLAICDLHKRLYLQLHEDINDFKGMNCNFSFYFFIKKNHITQF